jgi:hypothetical protein
MRKLILPLAAAAALALPASALAWGGGDHHSRHHSDANARFSLDVHTASPAGLEKLSGTGTSFASTSATATGSLVKSTDHPNGHFSATLATTWSSAQSKTFTDNDGDNDDGTVTVSCAPATASVTLSNGTSSTASYTGKTCSTTRNGSTKYAFFGAASNGTRAFLSEQGSTVSGAVFAGHVALHMGVFAAGHMGSCDHNH